MADVAATARSIVWIADEAWRDLGRHQVGRARVLAAGLVEQDGLVELADDADVAGDPSLVLRAARLAAEHDLPIGRTALERLTVGTDADAWATAWPDDARDELVGLLRHAHRAIDPLEALDQTGPPGGDAP